MRRTAIGIACASAALAVAAGILSATDASASRKGELRCGILTNPTPANWWLTDSDGEWTIGVQGGYQAEGLENMPEALFEDGWVRTNGYYGYRCACLRVSTDTQTMRVTHVHSGFGKPMRACDGDKALQKALSGGKS